MSTHIAPLPSDPDPFDPFAPSPPASGDEELLLSRAAAKRLEVLKAQEGNPDLMLRITVSGGGCSGYQYGFSLEDRVGENDRVFEQHGMRVITDAESLSLLNGAEVDYVNDLMGAYFQVNNPNATASCGCGTSFSV